MKKYSKTIPLVLLLALLTAALMTGAREFLSFDALKSHRTSLAAYVDSNYAVSVLVFASGFLAVSFVLPGALELTIASGFLFGTVPGALYSAVFFTGGSTLAFLASRHFLGQWVQDRHGHRLDHFNREIDRYGNNYLFVLRVLPLMPAFVVNYLSGLTRIGTFRFAAVSFIGVLPGSFVYAAAGRQLALIQKPDDIVSRDMVTAFALLAAAALAPAAYAHLRHGRKE